MHVSQGKHWNIWNFLHRRARGKCAEELGTQGINVPSAPSRLGQRCKSHFENDFKWSQQDRAVTWWIIWTYLKKELIWNCSQQEWKNRKWKAREASVLLGPARAEGALAEGHWIFLFHWQDHLRGEMSVSGCLSLMSQHSQSIETNLFLYGLYMFLEIVWLQFVSLYCLLIEKKNTPDRECS